MEVQRYQERKARRALEMGPESAAQLNVADIRALKEKLHSYTLGAAAGGSFEASSVFPDAAAAVFKGLLLAVDVHRSKDPLGLNGRHATCLPFSTLPLRMNSVGDF